MKKRLAGRGSGYLAGLDGWRAIAVTGVMLTHDFPHRIARLPMDDIAGFGENGVILFYAISGILICSRILEEEEICGRFSLKGFYIRRLLRIQPAALTFLVVIAAVKLGGLWPTGTWSGWVAALFLYFNFLSQPAEAGGLVGHFWTLSVEEHFYLFLSLFLYWVRRYRATLLALVVVALFTMKVIVVRLLHAQVSSRYTQYQLHYLLVPAWLAIVIRRAGVRAWAMKWASPSTVLPAIALVAAVAAARARWDPLHRPSHMTTSVVLLLPFAVLSTTLHPGAWPTRFLELAPLRYIGRISYGLYLWHVLFFRGIWPAQSITSAVFGNGAFVHFPLNWLFAFACAMLSYLVIERPFMRLGHRLSPPATPGRKDLGPP